MTTVICIDNFSNHDRQLVLSGKLPNHVYVGRSYDPDIGKWGNPFSHKRSAFVNVIKVGSAQEAVDRYENEKGTEPGFIDKVRKELYDKTLVCWCHDGQPCHARILAKWANDAKLFGVAKHPDVRESEEEEKAI